MLPHYSALKVAENFSMLSGLFLGRIDLGLGRAAGTDPRTALALQRNRGQQPADDFKEQMMELLGRLSDTLPAGRFVKPGMLPGRPEVPEPWLLGSSPQSAVWAGELGLPYMFADFINPGGAAYIGLYHEHFVPSVWIDRPRVGAAVWAISAESANEAEELASSSRMLFALLHQGQLIDVPSVDVALQYARENAAGIQNLTSSRRAILGTSADVRAGIEAVARDYRAEEVMVVSIVHSHRARRKSYELIADAFQLRGSLAVSR